VEEFPPLGDTDDPADVDLKGKGAAY
jgi:hypothetical protein